MALNCKKIKSKTLKGICRAAETGRGAKGKARKYATANQGGRVTRRKR